MGKITPLSWFSSLGECIPLLSVGEKTKTPGSVSGGKITPLSLVLCWSLLVFRAGPGLCWFSAGVCWFSAGLFTGASLAVTYVGGGLRGLSRPGVAACRGQAIFCPVTVTLARRRAIKVSFLPLFAAAKCNLHLQFRAALRPCPRHKLGGFQLNLYN